jgi:choline-glycine betaine transporter
MGLPFSLMIITMLVSLIKQLIEDLSIKKTDQSIDQTKQVTLESDELTV